VGEDGGLTVRVAYDSGPRFDGGGLEGDQPRREDLYDVFTAFCKLVEIPDVYKQVRVAPGWIMQLCLFHEYDFVLFCFALGVYRNTLTVIFFFFFFFFPALSLSPSISSR
jgi:hypothetical protein